MRSILTSLLVLSLAGEASAQTVPPAPVAAANGAPAASALAAPGFKIARAGTQAPVKGAAETFTGSVRLDPLFQAREPMNISGSYVTFEPGARTAWHSHPLGQILVVTAGTGLIQVEGGPIEEIHVGDVVSIPAGLKHWHGAAPGTPMTHLAIQGVANGKAAQWMEKVSDEQYRH